MDRYDPAAMRARSTSTPCPVCQSAKVASFTVTSMVVYLRCADCEYAWTIPERRDMPRGQDHGKRFG